MEDHAKPTSRTDPDHIKLHVGTNDLPTRKTPHEIAKSIVQLASALKTKSCDASISSITASSDQHRKKATKVNEEFKNICLENNLYVIDRGSTFYFFFYFLFSIFNLFYVDDKIEYNLVYVCNNS